MLRGADLRAALEIQALACMEGSSPKIICFTDDFMGLDGLQLLEKLSSLLALFPRYFCTEPFSRNLSQCLLSFCFTVDPATATCARKSGEHGEHLK